MINTSEQKKIKQVLGKHYSSEIVAHLKKRGFVNRNGNEHSANTVRKLITRKWTNDALEMEILKFVARREKAQAKIKQDRKRLLK